MALPRRLREPFVGADVALSDRHQRLPERAAADMSSIAPDRTREFAGRVAERGFGWVDAPLSGGVPGALAGRLSIMVGGDTHAVARAQTVLDHLAVGVTSATVAPDRLSSSSTRYSSGSDSAPSPKLRR